MTNLFFISSNGSMATKWLSELLSSSDSIQCFHGSKGLQENYDPNLKLETAFALAEEWALSHSTQNVGFVHLSITHGVTALPMCRDNGAQFCALVRNPILAADSQYQERLKNEELSDHKVDIFRKTVQAIPGLDTIYETVDRADVVFSLSTQRVIKHLLEIEHSDCLRFKFEDFTTNYATVREIIKTITNGAITEDKKIESAFETLGKLNTHRKTNKSFHDTWATSWSEREQKAFSAIWRYYLRTHQAKRTVSYPEVDHLISV